METLEKKIQLLLNLYKSKNLSKVESYSKELINSYPKIVVLYNILGLVLAEQNKIDEAVSFYEKGIKKVNYHQIPACMEVMRYKNQSYYLIDHYCLPEMVPL